MRSVLKLAVHLGPLHYIREMPRSQTVFVVIVVVITVLNCYRWGISLEEWMIVIII